MAGGNSTAQEMPNIRFGKYQIFRKLAIGGMAELFLAKQIGIGGFERTVVLKCILPHLVREPQFLTMFLDEARVASLLNHPNVVQIYEIGQEKDVYYIAMEYIRGPNLKGFRKRLYQRNPRPHYGLIAGIAAQTAAGLSYAHKATDEQGKALRIVHRDISPTNLLLSYTGAVKLVDFGVAKAAIQEHKTRAGMVKGKYRYMSPEQILAQPIDHRSDLYAFGAILYELATNIIVFGRRTEAETIRAVYQDPIMPPSKMIEGFPEKLDRIIMKCLEREPRDRYNNADELRRDLEKFMHQRGQFFGTQEIADFTQGLFAEEQEYERTGLSGSSLSKSDYMRFSFEISQPIAATREQTPSSPWQGTESFGSLPQIGNTSPSHSHPDAPTPDELSIPSAEPLSYPRNTGSYSHPSQVRTASNVHHNKSAIPESSSFRTPSFTENMEPIDDSFATKRTGFWFLIILLLLLAIGGGWFLWNASEPKKQMGHHTKKTKQKQQYHKNKFAEYYKEARSLLEKGDPMQANVVLLKLTEHTKTKEQQDQVQQLKKKIRQYIECTPKLDMAKEFYRKQQYKLAKQVLRSLQQRCSIVTEVSILLEQSIAAQKKKQASKSSSKKHKRRNKRRYSRRNKRRKPKRRRPRPRQRQPKQTAPRPRPIPQLGLLYVNAPSLARVNLDGRLFGFTPINGKQAKVGQHQLDVRLKGYHPYSKTITIQTGRSNIITIPMRKIARVKIAPVARRIVRRPPPRRTRRIVRKKTSRPFSSIRLPRQRVLRVFITDPRGITGRIYTNQHTRLCKQIEREVAKVMGSNYSVRGVTRAWQRYIRRYGARLGKDRLRFYPRAVAYIIYKQLKRGRSKRRTAQIIVNYERKRRWKRFLNR